MKNKLFLLFLLLLIFCQNSAAEEFIQVPAAIQIASKATEGKYGISDIVSVARENNIKVLIITDPILMKWEYGLWPFANIIKKTIEHDSVFKYGIKRYLKEIEEANKKNPDLVLIPAVEAAPFYYWQGSIFNRTLAIKDWHKHILAIGLEKEGDYKNLPVIGNKQGLLLPFRFKNILYLVMPLFLLLTGVLCLRKWWMNYKYFRFLNRETPVLIWIICGIFFLIAGLFLVLQNYPFRDFKFDQSRGDLGIMPYQNFVDYVHKHGGFTFWAHPEAGYITEIRKIKIETKEHSDALLKTQNYTGFAIFYEGYEKIGRPGGVWDEILMQYCRGKRTMPIWVIGALAFEATGDLGESMKDLRNILLVNKLDKGEILKALGEGRMYVARGKDSSQFVLDKFIIRDTATGTDKTMGECIEIKQMPQIEIKGHFLSGHSQPIKIKLIRDGSIIKIFDTLDISYQDEYGEKGEMVYYRIEIESPTLQVVTNPIFVQRR